MWPYLHPMNIGQSFQSLFSIAEGELVWSVGQDASISAWTVNCWWHLHRSSAVSFDSSSWISWVSFTYYHFMNFDFHTPYATGTSCGEADWFVSALHVRRLGQCERRHERGTIQCMYCKSASREVKGVKIIWGVWDTCWVTNRIDTHKCHDTSCRVASDQRVRLSVSICDCDF